jgi:SlyX protein
MSNPEDQIIDLQSRLAFQEDGLQAMNDVLLKQQAHIDALERELVLHREKLIELLDLQAERSSPMLSATDERPPHY